MISLRLILVIFALICFLLAFLGVNPPPRVALVPLGLFCWLLSEVVRA